MKNEIGGEYSTYGETGRCIQGFGGRADGRRPLGRPRLRLDYNIKVDLQEVGWAGMEWTDLAEDRGRC